jgi:hypothetical protein
MVTCICPPRWLTHPVDMALTCSRVGSCCPGIPPDSEKGKKSSKLIKLSFYHFIKAKLIIHSAGERFYGGVKIFKNFLIGS